MTFEKNLLFRAAGIHGDDWCAQSHGLDRDHAEVLARRCVHDGLRFPHQEQSQIVGDRPQKDHLVLDLQLVDGFFQFEVVVHVLADTVVVPARDDEPFFCFTKWTSEDVF